MVVSDSRVSSAAGLRRLAQIDPGKRLGELMSRPYQYRDWEDVYRDEWTWDDVVHVSHLRVNCIETCSFDAYVKDGIVWREEQNANYPQEFKDVPDFNPRGCTAGCAYSAQMYDPTRIRYPMKRIGERGSGRWQRLSWDQALEEIADKLIDVITEDGHDCIMYDHGTTNNDAGIATTMELFLFVRGLAATSIDSWAGVGDLPVGLIQSWGTYMSEGTADDWFRSDYIFIWLGNPNYTRQPDAHFLYEARYRGAKVVAVCPDFSPSTLHADRWLNVRLGTDAALALGMAHVIVEEGLHDVAYIKEQTDLSFLVRDDNGRFLRESDVVEGGAEDQFYFWNAAKGRKQLATGTWGSEIMTTALDEDTDPALEGAHRVRLANGTRIRVRPVFELLKARLAEYPPERAAEITGVPAKNIRTVARELARARSSAMTAEPGGDASPAVQEPHAHHVATQGRSHRAVCRGRRALRCGDHRRRSSGPDPAPRDRGDGRGRSSCRTGPPPAGVFPRARRPRKMDGAGRLPPDRAVPRGPDRAGAPGPRPAPGGAATRTPRGWWPWPPRGPCPGPSGGWW